LIDHILEVLPKDISKKDIQANIIVDNK